MVWKEGGWSLIGGSGGGRWLAMRESVVRTSRFNAEGAEEEEGSVQGAEGGLEEVSSIYIYYIML